MMEADRAADKIILLVTTSTVVLYGFNRLAFEETVVMLLFSLCVIGVNIPYRNDS